MPISRGADKPHRAVTNYFAGKHIWKVDNLRAWDKQIEINIIKRDKYLSNTDALQSAYELIVKLMENITDDD